MCRATPFMVVGSWLHLDSCLEICLCIMAVMGDYEPRVVLFFMHLQKLLKAFLGLFEPMPHVATFFYMKSHESVKVSQDLI